MKEIDYEENSINEQKNINNINNSEEKKEKSPSSDKPKDLIESKHPEEDSIVPDAQELTIITKQANKAFITIKKEKSELSFICYYYKDYFKTVFKNTFSFDKLKELSQYYNQFSEIKEVYNEIYFNPKKDQVYLQGNENLQDEIKFIIPLTSNKYKFLTFKLNKVKKDHNDIFQEYQKVVALYKNQVKINNFNSKILELRETDQEYIKSWISPLKALRQIYYIHFIIMIIIQIWRI